MTEGTNRFTFLTTPTTNRLAILTPLILFAGVLLLGASTPGAVTAGAVTSAAIAQTNKPAVEYQSLLKLPYYEDSGGFLVEHLELLFPPSGNQKFSFVITTKTGQEVARVPLRVEPLRSFEVFRLLQPNGVPGVVRIGRSGDFVMSVLAGDQPITSLPFSLKEEKSTDPYNPKTRFVREGPWRELAYFSSPVDKPDTPIKFNWWISQRELPAGAPKRPMCTVHLMQGSQEIATTRSPVVPDAFDWQFYKKELVQSTGPNVQWLTLASLTKKDADLTVVIKVNGQPVKSYRLQVRSGKVQRLARNQLEVEPHTDFISPRLVDVSRDGGCEYCMLDLFWVTAR